MIEEIHLSDSTLRNNYVEDWKQNNYEDASEILNSIQLNNKKLVAKVFNDITTFIVNLENNSDPSFKSNKIVVSEIAPTGLSSGSVWFQEI